MKRLTIIGVLAAACLGVAAGCGPAPDGSPDRAAGEKAQPEAEKPPKRELIVSDGRVQVMPGMGAGYLKIVNHTGEPQRLTAATSPVAQSVSIHETVVEDGVVRMKARDNGFIIPPGKELLLEPAGKHLMLHALNVDAKAQQVPITLSFENHPPIELSAFIIRAGRASAPADPASR
jgi:copper(I)-binding protein